MYAVQYSYVAKQLNLHFKQKSKVELYLYFAGIIIYNSCNKIKKTF